MSGGSDWWLEGPAGGMVEAWSVRRLPFEPTGALLELRSALRQALSSLTNRAGPGYRLSAVYRSVGTDLVDAENVLLYNVGAACFGRPMSVHVERRFE